MGTLGGWAEGAAVLAGLVVVVRGMGWIFGLESRISEHEKICAERALRREEHDRSVGLRVGQLETGVAEVRRDVLLQGNRLADKIDRLAERVAG